MPTNTFIYLYNINSDRHGNVSAQCAAIELMMKKDINSSASTDGLINGSFCSLK